MPELVWHKKEIEGAAKLVSALSVVTLARARQLRHVQHGYQQLACGMGKRTRTQRLQRNYAPCDCQALPGT